jgi:hypothetical protein
LAVGLSRETTGFCVLRVGPEDVVENLDDPSVIAVSEIVFGALYDGVGSAHVSNVSPCRLARSKRIECCRIAVVPTENAGVDRSDVVANVTVIASEMPFTGKTVREPESICDLGGCVSVVHEAHGLVMLVQEGVALLPEERSSLFGSEARPMVTARDYFYVVEPEGSVE